MSENSENPTQLEGKLITRRKFLRLGGLSAVAVGGVVTSGAVEKKVVDLLFQLFSNPKSGEGFLSTTAHFLGKEKENLKFRSMDAIVSQGIKDYEEKNRRKALFIRSSDYKEFSKYQESIEEIKQGIGIVAKNPLDLAKPFLDSFPQSAQTAVHAADSNFGDYLGVMSDNSGMYKRFIRKYPEFTNKPFLGEVIDKAKIAAKDYLLEAKKCVEEEVEKKGGLPISTSVLLEYFLIQNQGDIADSLNDTYIFLKFAARNDFQSGDYAANETNIRWMKNHIIDEYGYTSYQTESEDLINLIGKPYHSWNLVAMLSSLPPEIVEIAGTYRQVSHLSQQGPSKLHADLVTLADLQKVEEALAQYKK